MPTEIQPIHPLLALDWSKGAHIYEKWKGIWEFWQCKINAIILKFSENTFADKDKGKDWGRSNMCYIFGASWISDKLLTVGVAIKSESQKVRKSAVLPTQFWWRFFLKICTVSIIFFLLYSSWSSQCSPCHSPESVLYHMQLQPHSTYLLEYLIFMCRIAKIFLYVEL